VMRASVLMDGLDLERRRSTALPDEVVARARSMIVSERLR
jgi:hypothetical protein